MGKHEAERQFKTASQLYAEGQFAQALEILDALDAKYPNVERIQFPRALCLAKQGRRAEARDLCDAMISASGNPKAVELKAKLTRAEATRRMTPEDMPAPLEKTRVLDDSAVSEKRLPSLDSGPVPPQGLPVFDSGPVSAQDLPVFDSGPVQAHDLPVFDSGPDLPASSPAEADGRPVLGGPVTTLVLAIVGGVLALTGFILCVVGTENGAQSGRLVLAAGLACGTLAVPIFRRNIIAVQILAFPVWTFAPLAVILAIVNLVAAGFLEAILGGFGDDPSGVAIALLSVTWGFVYLIVALALAALLVGAAQGGRLVYNGYGWPAALVTVLVTTVILSLLTEGYIEERFLTPDAEGMSEFVDEQTKVVGLQVLTFASTLFVWPTIFLFGFLDALVAKQLQTFDDAEWETLDGAAGTQIRR